MSLKLRTTDFRGKSNTIARLTAGSPACPQAPKAAIPTLSRSRAPSSLTAGALPLPSHAAPNRVSRLQSPDPSTAGPQH